MVFATAVRLLGNRSEAEDIAQQVFLRAFQRFAAIGASPSAPGWLRTVTRNLCLNHLSRYRRRWRFFSELASTDASGDIEPFDPGASSVESPAHLVERADRHQRLEQALLRLPDHQRVPLALFHFDDMSYHDIATTLGVSLGKVKTDIHRGRDALRKELLADGPR